MRVALDTNVVISDLIFGSPTIAKVETVVTPLDSEPGAFDIRDPKGYPVLYSAILADAEVLVTGDKDFGDVDVGRPEILTPAEYVERYVRG